MYAVIMAGGSGTRFWPLSRTEFPKQFLDIVGNKSMLLQTYERVSPIVPDDKIYVVVGKVHEKRTQEVFSGRNVKIVLEPEGKNTAPCIGLASMLISVLNDDEPVVILPADHYVAKPDAFRKNLEMAVEIASSEDCIVTLGIVPTRPETGYGYIERTSEEIKKGIFRVKSFVEKPDFELACEYLKSGNYFWNAGIFVAKASVLLHEFSEFMPHFYEGLIELREHIGKSSFEAKLADLYSKTENISFDYAIMEKTSMPVFVVASDCGWSDVGSWFSLYELRVKEEGDEFGNLMDGEGAFFDCNGCFVVSRTRRWIGLLGLSNVLVVDTDDALLVADIEKHQRVRLITDYLKKRNYKKLL